MSKNNRQIVPGNPETLGARETEGGLNFAMALPEDTEAYLVITDRHGKEKQRIPLPEEDRTGKVSAVLLKGVQTDEIGYYYEADGERLVDPYSARISDGISYLIHENYDWKGVRCPEIPTDELVIMKLHVRGFTMKARRGIRHKGSWKGIEESIPYLKELGVNAIEVMPMYEWDDALKVQPYAPLPETTDEERPCAVMKNYWGYAKNNYYFAPKQSFSSQTDSVQEIRDLITALHKEGIELIMEMYFPDHTDPLLAVMALHFWKSCYHVDGFRFVGSGVPVASIVKDPLLTRTKLLFEYLDTGWVYGGKAPKRRNILICNDEFLKTGRSLLKGDEGQIARFVMNLRRNPATHAYISNMSATNGFTLYDAVCYDWKHNEENGENNQDGSSSNYSWNCGAEGPCKKKAVRLLRERQLKNAFVYSFLSQGVPYFLAGDEGLNTQGGNNNAYASDNNTGWTDWNYNKDAEELRSFVKKLSAFRRENKIFHMASELRGSDYRNLGCPDLSYHDTRAWMCSMENSSRSIGVLYNGKYAHGGENPADDFFYVAYNAYWESHMFALPSLPAGYEWIRVIDTAAPAGQEFDQVAAETDEPMFTEAGPRSVLVLRSRKTAVPEKAKPANTAKTKRKAE